LSTRQGAAQGKDLKQVFADVRSVMDPVFGQALIYGHCGNLIF